MTSHPNNTFCIGSLAGTPNHSSAGLRQIGTSRTGLVRAILGVTFVAASIGLLVISSLPSTVAPPRLNAQVTPPVIDPWPAFFIATGDGSRMLSWKEWEDASRAAQGN